MSATERRRKFSLELRIIVRDLRSLVKVIDKKIDKLMARLISEEEHNQLFHNLRGEIDELKKYQEDLKSEFTEIATGSCGMKSREHELVLKRRTKTIEEMKDAKARIREFRRKEEGVIQKLNECSSVFQEKEEDSESELLTSHGKHEIEVVLDSLGLENFDGEWDLPEVTKKMYRLAPERTKTEDELLKKLEAVFLNHAKDMKDTMRKFLTDERLRGQREELAVLLQGFKEMINGKLEVLDYQEKVFEAEKLIVNWLLVMEVEIYLLVKDLIFLISSDQEAVSELRGFKQKFAELKRSKRGRVPITVYCLLILLGREIETVKDSETEFLFGEIHGQVDHIMDRVYKMITSDIMFVLNVLCLRSSHLNKKEAVLVAAEVLQRCDEELKSSQSEIKKAMEA